MFNGKKIWEPQHDLNISKSEVCYKGTELYYCKFRNFCEGFIFAQLHMRSFVKIKSSRICEITLFTDISKSSPCGKFLKSQIYGENKIHAKISEFTVSMT